jgi:ubiquinone/menaquinone biosynthesis C-methylase UbiE
MNPLDKLYMNDRYNLRLKEKGATIEALASGTEERRNIRFRTLTEVGISSGDRVLDLGCGFGDFWLFCQKNNLKIDYTGIDINPLLIEKAQKRFENIKFEVKDIQTDKMEKFDYVVSTSCFNLDLPHDDNYAFIENLLQRCYTISKKGVAIDFLTSYVDFRGVQEAFYYSPERIFSIAKKISKRVCLRHDYPLFEFTVYLYPDFQGWQQ